MTSLVWGSLWLTPINRLNMTTFATVIVARKRARPNGITSLDIASHLNRQMEEFRVFLYIIPYQIWPKRNSANTTFAFEVIAVYLSDG